jgi:hypothetical protein
MEKVMRKRVGKNNSKLMMPTPWEYDESDNAIISVPTGEIVFELNISPLQSTDKANIAGMLAAINMRMAKESKG